MELYRIAKCAYITDLTGRGAAMFGGRWNSKDVYVLYTAATPSLALLEALAHMGQQPEGDFCMIRLEVPDTSIKAIAMADLPTNWAQNPPSEELKEIGDSFYRTNKHLLLRLPSAIMPEESNYIINTRHKLISQMRIAAQRNLVPDGRLLR